MLPYTPRSGPTAPSSGWPAGDGQCYTSAPFPDIIKKHTPITPIFSFLSYEGIYKALKDCGIFHPVTAPLTSYEGWAEILAKSKPSLFLKITEYNDLYAPFTQENEQSNKIYSLI